MNVYPSAQLRNVCLLGHGSDGKTSLAESALFLTGATDRLGKIPDGNTVCDYDPEEAKRQFTISAAIAPVEFNGAKINLIDTPGFFDFTGEIMEGIRVCEAALILVSAKNGVGVGTEKSWKYINEAGKPRLFYISKMDEENADYFKTLAELREKFGVAVCPVVLPIVENGKLVGVVDIVTDKGYTLKGGKPAEMDIPASLNDQVEEAMGYLNEAVAMSDDELMDKYFNGVPFTPEELTAGLKAGIANGSVAPVFCGSAISGIGTLELLWALKSYVTNPLEATAEKAADASGNEVEIARDESGATAALVFKTVSDQYGKFSYFKVMRGKVSADSSLTNARTGQPEKIGHVYVVRGKERFEVKEVACGDIGAVSKLVDAKTGDTLCSGAPVSIEGIEFPKPCYTLAIQPKVKGTDEKIAAGLAKMNEEDLTFTTKNNAETHQYLISGLGDMHIEVICARLKAKFGVEAAFEAPIIPYREKIRKKVKVQGKHKKQSGGHGQYGDVWIEFEPNVDDSFAFAENVFGGSVPRNFFPAVEKGLRECISKGVLAGYPVVGLKATLVDGSYHDVDSSEMAFKLAASLAYKAGLPLANPVLLEPIGTLKVLVPDKYMGDIIGDLNKRRGRVLGMDPAGDGQQQVTAEVPMAEMNTYAIDLRSVTQGRGSFEFNFERYEEAPANVQQAVVEEAKKRAADEAAAEK